MLAFLAACQQGAPWATKDISGLMPDLAFNLVEANGDRPVSATDYRDKIVMLYFGYTHCPDVCPTTLTHMRSAVNGLGKQADQIRVLFVSVDPKRDSLAYLKRYVEYFGPQIIGLRGEHDALRTLTKRYRVTYGYSKSDAQGNYEVSHSSAVYVFDGNGKVRLLIRPDDKVADITADLKRLLSEEKTH
jgi:protein SCO1/2